MSTAQERYDLAKKNAEDLSRLMKDMQTVGVCQTEELKAIGLLNASLVKAMYILDPDETVKWAGDLYEDAKASLQDGQLPGPSSDGMYL
jgi:hypothetical protein